MYALLAALALAGADPPQARVDRFGDPLPAGARFRIGSTRLQLGQAIHGLAASPDGKLVAAAGHDTIALWDAATGREVRRLKGWGIANQNGIAFTGDGQAVAVNTVDELVLVDTITGNVRARLGPTASRLIIAPDGKTLTGLQWGGDARTPAIRVWELQTARQRSIWGYRPELSTGIRDDQLVVRFCLSRDGRTLAVVEIHPARNRQLVRFCDTATGKELRRCQTTDLQALACSLSPDGKLLATGTENGVVRVLDTATGNEVRRWKAVLDPGMSTSLRYAETVFAPDGASLFCNTPAGLVRRDWRTGRTLQTYPDTLGPPVLLLDGKVLAGWGPTFSVRLLDIATGADRCPLPRAGEHFAVSPDGRHIAHTDRAALILSDMMSGAEVRRWDANVPSDGLLVFAPDGKIIAARGPDESVRLWEVATGRAVGTVRPAHRIASLAFAPGGRQLVIGHTGLAGLWDIATGKRLNRWMAESVIVAPNLAIVANADRKNRHIRLTDATSDRLLHTLTGYRERVRYGYAIHGRSVGVGTTLRPRFSPDGRLLVAGGDGTQSTDSEGLYLWNTATGRRMLVLPGETTILNGIAFSPDSRLLALMRSDCRLCLVNAATGTTVRTLGQGKDRMDVLPVFTPDGRLLVTAIGGLIQVWEVATGGEICRRSGQRGNVHTLTMSPDGRSVATAAYDQTILVWDLVHLVETPAPAESLWADLASRDAVRGRAAIEALVAQSGKAVALLRERLPPLRVPDAKQLARWIAELDSDDFDQRQHAEAELDRHHEAAVLPLQQALGGKVSLEARRRIEGLLRKHDLGIISLDELRRGRALQALELIGTAEARALTRALSGV